MRAVLLLAAALAALVAGGAPKAPAQPAVLVIEAARPAGPPEIATGVAVGPGRVLTVAHVLDGGGALSVRGPDGIARPATPARVDRRLDVAVLAVPGLRAPLLRTGDATADARVLLLREDGPQARSSPVRRRIVAHLVDQPGAPRRPALELAADVRHGDSGAPVLTRDGRLAGLVYARSATRPRTAYAVRGPALAGLIAPAAAPAVPTAR